MLTYPEEGHLFCQVLHLCICRHQLWLFRAVTMQVASAALHAENNACPKRKAAQLILLDSLAFQSWCSLSLSLSLSRIIYLFTLA